MKPALLVICLMGVPAWAAGHLGTYTGFTYPSQKDCLEAAQTAARKIVTGTKGELKVLEVFCANYQVHVTYVTTMEKSVAEKQILLTQTLPALSRTRSMAEDLRALFFEIEREFESSEFQIVEVGESEINGKSDVRAYVIDQRGTSAKKRPVLYLGVSYNNEECKTRLKEMLSATSGTFGQAAGYCLRLNNAEGHSRPAIFSVY